MANLFFAAPLGILHALTTEDIKSLKALCLGWGKVTLAFRVKAVKARKKLV
jgi:hypothetical protein